MQVRVKINVLIVLFCFVICTTNPDLYVLCIIEMQIDDEEQTKTYQIKDLNSEKDTTFSL